MFEMNYGIAANELWLIRSTYTKRNLANVAPGNQEEILSTRSYGNHRMSTAECSGPETRGPFMSKY